MIKTLEFIKKPTVLLISILILALSLRLWNLGNNPAGFFCDEASIGYNAYSLITTGKDEHGNPWPVFFRAFGEYKNPVQIYSSTIPIAIFGLNELSTRLTSVFYGVLAIAAIYLLAKNLFDQKVAIVSSLLLAISPWHTHFSRTAFELMPYVTFTILGTHFWLKSCDQNYTAKNLVPAIIFFALAIYSYFPARIFIPLFTLTLILVEIRGLTKKPKTVFLGTALAFLFTLPMLMHVFLGPGQARWQQVSSEKPLGQIVKNYFDHFSPSFLFTKGDINFPGQFITRHSVRGMGELYFFQLPLLLIGFFALAKNIRQRHAKVLFFWLLLYPTGTIFTDAQSPQATRSIIGVVPFQIISALGMVKFLDLFKNTRLLKTISLIIFLILSLSLLGYLTLLKNYPLYSSDFWGWQYGPKEIIEYFLKNQEKYDQLIMTGRFNAPEMFLKFYGKGDCKKCLIGDLDLLDTSKKQLFALTIEGVNSLKPPHSFFSQKRISYPNGSLAFQIGEIKNTTQKGHSPQKERTLQ